MHYCEKRMDGKKQNEIKQWGREIKSMHTDWFISLTHWIKKSFFFYMQRNAGKYAKLPQSTSFFYFMKFECKQTIFLWYLQVGCLIYLEKKNSNFNVKQPGICQIKCCKCSIFACLPCQVKASIIQSFQCLPCQVKAIIIFILFHDGRSKMCHDDF